MRPDEQLDRFVARVDELVSTRLVRNDRLRSQLQMRATVDQPVSISIHDPDEEDLRSFLLTFRQFISDREPVFVNQIANAVWQGLDSDDLRGRLEEGRRRWKQASRQGTMGFVLNGERITPERVLDLWINGHYFHNDERKAEALRRFEGIAGVLTRHMMIDLLVDTTKYLLLLRSIIITGRSQNLLHVPRRASR